MDSYGTTEYLPNLIASLSEETQFLFPPQIFTSILLCLAAGHKHLILRVNEREVNEIKAIVVQILVTIFGLPTQKIDVHAEDTVQDFLHSIFLVPPTSYPLTPSVISRSHMERSRSRSRNHYRQDSLQRSISGTSLGKSLPPSGFSTPLYHSLLSHARTDSHDTNLTGTTTLKNRSPSVGATLTVTNVRKERSMSGLIPDDSSTRALRPQSVHGLHLETNPPTPTTPLASLPPLPSPGEYTSTAGPSFSSAPTPRLPHALVMSHLEKGKRSVQDALNEILRLKRIVLDEEEEEFGEQVPEISRRHSHTRGSIWNLPTGFMVVYVCPLGDGRERPPVQKTLLDRFSFCADMTPETAAYAASPGPFRRAALVSREDIEKLQQLSISTYLSPHLETYMASLLSAVRHHPHLDGTLLTARAMSDYMDLVRASQVVFGKQPRSPALMDKDPEVHRHSHMTSLSATELDARRMLPFALEHRLRVRDEPRDGALGSLYFTAVGGGKDLLVAEEERETVQTVIQYEIIERV
ncbi:hypothetical protein FRC03_009626 [Tulasnella sp. 419]|nr:hypothetical protein FRC03_009626 [Tulasnella sp. 419]